MKVSNLKKYSKFLIIWTVSLMIYIFLLLTLNYTGLLKYSVIVKFNFIIIAIMSFILGVFMGKKTTKKGYLEGLKIGLIITIILFILNLIFYRSINLNTFVYYLIIVVGSIFGSMLGINLKRS